MGASVGGDTTFAFRFIEFTPIGECDSEFPSHWDHPTLYIDHVEDNSVACKDCESRFDSANVTAGGCVPRKCRCTNGEPLVGETGQCALITSGADKGKAFVNCKQGACKLGYHRDPTSRQCEESECRCLHGTPAKGAGTSANDTCPSFMAVMCKDCKPGFHKVARGKAKNITLWDCAINVCDAKDKKDPSVEHFPLQGVPCPVDGVTRGFDSCANNKYQLLNKECIFKECRCDHGVAARGAECPKHQDRWCMNCTDFYHSETYTYAVTK